MRVPGTVQGGVVVLEQPSSIPDGTRVIVEAPEPQLRLQRRRPGSAAGILIVVDEDDEHLKDFAEYT